LSAWKWILEIPRDAKCGHCQKRLFHSKEHLIEWNSTGYHLECLLDKLTNSESLAQTQPLAAMPWGLPP
jgi:hypothetical protein